MDKNKKEIIITLIKLALIIIIAVVLVRVVSTGETLTDYNAKQQKIEAQIP